MTEIIIIPHFDRHAKPLKKKYPSFVNDLKNLIKELRQNPHMGVELAPGIRKVRMAIESKGRGKSGGARVITFETVWAEIGNALALVEIYDKAQTATIKTDVIKNLLQELGLQQ